MCVNPYFGNPYDVTIFVVKINILCHLIKNIKYINYAN